MTDGDRDRDRRSSCSELIKRLEGPLSFVGETGSPYVNLDGRRHDLSKLIEHVEGSIVASDELVLRLSVRLEEIKERLRSCSPDTREPKALYEEGVAIKRALHLLKRRSGTGADPHEDLRRWLKYGREIS